MVDLNALYMYISLVKLQSCLLIPVIRVNIEQRSLFWKSFDSLIPPPIVRSSRGHVLSVEKVLTSLLRHCDNERRLSSTRLLFTRPTYYFYVGPTYALCHGPYILEFLYRGLLPILKANKNRVSEVVLPLESIIAF